MIHFVSSDNKAISKFSNHGVQVDFKNGAIKVNDHSTGTTFSPKKSIEDSANEFLAPEYKIDIKSGKVFSGENVIFQCEAKDNCSLNALSEDISAINEVSKLIRNQESPTLMIFHLKSLFNLNQFTSLHSKGKLIELVNSSFKKVSVFDLILACWKAFT